MTTEVFEAFKKRVNSLFDTYQKKLRDISRRAQAESVANKKKADEEKMASLKNKITQL